MIDTHCHLSDPRLLEQLDDVLGRAAAAGVAGMVTIGTHPADWEAALAIARAHRQVRCAIGIHPNYCHEAGLEQADRLRALQADERVVALGEMGLDYHYDYAPRQRQATFFRKQLELARDLDRAAVIHCREAVADCLEILREFPGVRAVFHSFTGTAADAERILEAGYLIGFTGIVTFKNAGELREVARTAPAGRMLIETDAPYLTPEPMRKQKINEPAMVVHTAAVIAQVRGITVEELSRQTTANASSFYGVDL